MDIRSFFHRKGGAASSTATTKNIARKEEANVTKKKKKKKKKTKVREENVSPRNIESPRRKPKQKENLTRKSKKRRKQIIESDSDEDHAFETQPPPPKSPMRRRTPKKRSTPKLRKPKTKIEKKQVSATDFFGVASQQPSASKKEIQQPKTVEEEEIEVAKAISLSEVDQGVTSKYFSKGTKVTEIINVDEDDIGVDSNGTKREDDVIEVSPTLNVKDESKKKTVSDSKSSQSKHSASISSTSTKKNQWYPGKTRSPPPKAGQKELPKGNPDCLKGLFFVITGTLESLERDQAKDLIMEHGGKVTGGVSGRTSYLVAGKDAGAKKMKLAKDKGSKIIDEDGLFELVRSRTSKKANTDPKKQMPAEKRTPAISVSTFKDVAYSAPTTSKSSDQNSGDGKLWVDKHRPMCTKHLIGNNSNIKKLKDFLVDWREAIAKKRVKSLKHRAVLLAGPAGLGKSTAADVVAKELGFNKLEFNASDVRNKASIEQEVLSVACNKGIMQFMGSKKGQHRGPTVLVMDEVDGMSGNADRGGMQQLIKIIKGTQVPIICICNDDRSQKLKSLRNYCLPLKFRRPSAAQVRPRIMEILRSEGMQVEENAFDVVVESTRGDIRQILNLMQMWRKRNAQVRYKDARVKMNAVGGKDFDLGPFDVISKVFASDINPGFILRKSDHYFVDFSLMPLMVEENYMNVKRYSGSPFSDSTQRPDMQVIQALAEASASFSDGDILDSQLRRTQDWSLLPYHGFYTTVVPGSLFAGNLGRPMFPSWLGKNSKRNKISRFFKLLKTNMSVDSNSSANDLAMYEICELRRKLVQPMTIKEDPEGGIRHVIDLLDQYSLDRNDWEMVVELGSRFDQPLSAKSIPSKVKSAFTRTYNQEGHQLKVARQDLKAVKKQAKKESQMALHPSGDANEDDDEEDMEIATPKVLKKKRKSSSKGKAQRKRKKKSVPINILS